MQEKGCEECEPHDLAALEQVGGPTQTEFLGGSNIETHTRFRCRACGTVWLRIKERGAGGRGTFWS